VAAVGLANPDSPGWLCGIGEDHTGVRAVRIDYRPPDAQERLMVQTQLAVAAVPSFNGVPDQLDSSEDDGEPLELYGDALDRPDASSPVPRSEVVINGERVSAVRWQAGASTLWLASTGAVTLLVGARSVRLDHVELEQIHDLGPMKQMRSRVVDEFLRSQPHPPPPYRPIAPT
jgi:hypothetical protein